MLILSVPIGIALRLRTKKLFLVNLLVLVSLAAVITQQYMAGTKTHNFSVEILQWLALAGGVVWLYLDANYMARKRKETQEKTQQLQTALTENNALINHLTTQKEIAEAANLANLAKSRLVAAANHDLRQPFHALNLFVAQLKTCKTPEAQALVIQKIESSVDGISELFENLLDVSSMDADVVSANISSVSVQMLFNKLETMFAETAAKKNLRLHFVKTQLCVKSESVLLERILLNLICNALRYTEQGGVVIGCRRRGGEVFIQVCDTGCGIACEQRPHIFKEFYRIPSQGNTTIGLGLGLAIVEKLCTLLNHRVLMNSRPSKGSCFSIVAPATQQTKIPKNDSWILIVDDEISVRDAMRILLTEWGYKVLVANSNHDAMQLVFAQQKTPDLIICDFHLHDGKHGLQLISDMSAYFSKKIPAFLISGCKDPSTQTAVYQAGFTLLGKPLKPMALRAIIQQTLHC
jgi:signal transduction histidine kinase/CheY-like chemotaxis protein